MADNEDNDAAERAGSSATGPAGTTSGAGNAQSRAGGSRSDAQTRAKVTWRGIVEDPDGEQPPRRGSGVLTGIGTLFASVFEALGLKRRRNDDGTLGPRHLKRSGIIFGVIVFVLLIVSSFHVIQAGTVAVPITFGDAGSPQASGLRLTLPWPIASVTSMSVQTQNYTMSGAADVEGTDDPVVVLGSDGASGTVDATVLFRLRPERASDVYRNIGTDYTNKLVKPSARSCIRTEFAGYDLVSGSTDALPEVADKVTRCMRDKIEGQGIELQDFQLREVTLGADLATAVNAKAAAQQNAEAQRFQKASADQVAEITRVQAQATSDAQQILACGGTTQTVDQNGLQTQVVVPNPSNACNPPQLTQEILQYSYIQALRDLMNSPNVSTIIVPGGGDGASPQIVVPTPTTPSTSGN